ncbi:MAG: GxxExxY protein [Phycisphaerales bacterium]|nr:GxxExxY protein [Phycisphaerales bacterium]
MNADERGLKHKELTEKVIGAFYEVYNELGPGFLESVYERSMVIALRAAGLQVAQQVPVPVYFRGELVGEFSADLLVEQSVIVELKAARAVDPIFEAQTLNYLRATPIEVGLLLNFGPKPYFRRFAYDNARKTRTDPGPS